jgi:hypothetical protein
MTLLEDNQLFRFYITERTMRSKLSFNNYYTITVKRRSFDQQRYETCHTKSFNKETYSNAKQLAEEYLEKVKCDYC